METYYRDVTSRLLNPAERRVTIDDIETPLVIEPSAFSGASFLQEFLTSHSSLLLRDLSKHGALLLRGFEISSPATFERCMLSIRSMYGMSDILFSEPGRTIVHGTHHVFHTNTLVKTGGTLLFGAFHSENYGVPDVPRYIAFLCETPSNLGGETGLVNIAKVYADLPNELKHRLEEKTCLVCLYPVAEVAKRYGLPEELIEHFCSSVGLPIVTIQGKQYVAIYKPSVVQHPLTDERTLLISFSQIPPLQAPVLDAFRGDYAGPQWLLHRLFWKTSWLASSVARASYSPLYQRGAIYVTEAPTPVADARPVAALFSHEDVRVLARAMRRHYSSFHWKRGDILILDNLKLAHNGMAGHGKRELKVMMCNPLWLPSSEKSSGLHVIPHSNGIKECLGAQLAQFRADRLS